VPGAILIVIAMLFLFPPLVFFLGLLISVLIGTVFTAPRASTEEELG
jgi:hypothetical protein